MTVELKVGDLVHVWRMTDEFPVLGIVVKLPSEQPEDFVKSYYHDTIHDVLVHDMIYRCERDSIFAEGEKPKKAEFLKSKAVNFQPSVTSAMASTAMNIALSCSTIVNTSLVSSATFQIIPQIIQKV